MPSLLLPAPDNIPSFCPAIPPTKVAPLALMLPLLVALVIIPFSVFIPVTPPKYSAVLLLSFTFKTISLFTFLIIPLFFPAIPPT